MKLQRLLNCKICDLNLVLSISEEFHQLFLGFCYYFKQINVLNYFFLILLHSFTAL